MENSNKRYIAIGLMLFALLFGAGNLIFPAAMGQNAGVNVWYAVLGFCVTGVGLPSSRSPRSVTPGVWTLKRPRAAFTPGTASFTPSSPTSRSDPASPLPVTGTVVRSRSP